MSIALEQLAEKIGAGLFEGGRAAKRLVDTVYAGDRVSDLLTHASDTTLIVTNLANSSVVRLIELMDVPGVCLLNGARPERSLLDAAEEHGAALLISPEDMFKTCGKIHKSLEEQSVSQA